MPLGSVITQYVAQGIQLGLVALAFGGLQLWWISSTLRKRELAKPLSEDAFRKTIERVGMVIYRGDGQP